MKKTLMIVAVATGLMSCMDRKSDSKPTRDLSEDFKSYWYSGKAEISSYRLSQARYGELRDGTAVLVFVTEPFSIEKNTKADYPTDKDVSVLKLNFDKKFATGIYPYSMMTSTFFPVSQGAHALKVSTSSQEWCGHTYMEMRNRHKYDISLSSYFEGESFEHLLIDKEELENDVWALIRIAPADLPVGRIATIPSFFYLRLMHKETRAYECLRKMEAGDSLSTYTLEYPELSRTLSIRFETDFPHRIVSWEESYPDGAGDKRQKLTTAATLIGRVNTDYWNKNAVKDSVLRHRLGLN